MSSFKTFRRFQKFVYFITCMTQQAALISMNIKLIKQPEMKHANEAFG